MYNQQNEVKWSFGWMNDVDPQRLTLFPIQLANCRRLEDNNAVYLFDEVGSGKTLSSGMMALHYLYHLTHETHEKPQKAKNKKDVLVITTNALCRPSGSSENGQFLDDWFQKLPFERLGYVNKIELRNHHYSHYQKNTRFKLVIIDEAHLFLNQDSLRFQNLCENIRADKVIFLTATPIKSDQAKDLQTYVKIAERITGDFDSSWIEQLNTIGKENKDIISCGFDPKLPVSRYFKETITALTTTNKVQRNCKRMPTELSYYGLIEQNDENGNTSAVHIDKKEALLNYIAKHQNSEDRFVVFVRYVEQEAYELGRFLSLEQNGFEQFKPFQAQNIQKSYAVVTGDNAYELHNYDQDIDPLPNVLILTYQIAEQGVNLPGFNHVINYHISQFPSALEQRYGRIDRIRKRQTEEEKEIYNCFLIRKNGYDTSTRNFRLATWNYIINILGNLPSKNAMLTPEMLNYIVDDGKFLECYKQKVDEFLRSKKVENLKTLLYNDYSQSQKDEEMDNYEDIENIEEKDDLTYEIYHFIKQSKLEWKPEDSWETFVDEICTEFNKELNQNINLKEKLKKKIPLIQNLLGAGGDVLYLYEPFHQINEDEYSFEDCARVVPLDKCKTMVDNSAYQSFTEELHKECPLPFIRQLLKDTSVLDCWEKKFEDYFREGQFDSLFPIAGYQQCYGEVLVEDAIEKIEEINNDDIELIRENTEKIILDLPLFKMFDIFRKEIQDIYTKQGSETGILQQFINPFGIKMFGLKNKVWNLGLSKAFEEKYWNGGSVSDYNHFFEIVESDGKIMVPEWLKLVYEYTRLEAAVVWGSSNSDGYFFQEKVTADKENIFFCLEEDIRKYCQTSNKDSRQEYCQKFLKILQDFWWKSYTRYAHKVSDETMNFVIKFKETLVRTETALQELKKRPDPVKMQELINNCSCNMGACKQIARNEKNKEICYRYFQMIENYANEVVQGKVDETQWSKRAYLLEQFRLVMEHPNASKAEKVMFLHYFNRLYTAHFNMHALSDICEWIYEKKGCSLFEYYSYVNSAVDFRTYCKQYKELKLNQLNLEGVTDYWTRGIIHDLQKQNIRNRVIREKYDNRRTRYFKDDASIKEFLDCMKSCYMGNFLELFD